MSEKKEIWVGARYALHPFPFTPRKHSEEDLKRFTAEELDEMDLLEDMARAEEAEWEATEPI